MAGKIKYLNSENAISQHAEIMRLHQETRHGLNSLAMLESTLARPKNAATYENADVLSQAATLYFGLVKNRIWHGGHKRTATILLKQFLSINDWQSNWTLEEIVQLGRNVDTDIWKIDEIEIWLRQHVTLVSKYLI